MRGVLAAKVVDNVHSSDEQLVAVDHQTFV